MALNERELQEVQQNKSIRGYIVRCLVKGSNNSAITKHISNALFVQGMIMSPDIGKYVDYLVSYVVCVLILHHRISVMI